ncbi:MAG: dTMP kinase [Hormoscilla sp.]
MQGKLIVFEGTEGSGKTTQLQLLYQWWCCRETPVAVTREPGGTPLGEKLRQILLTDSAIAGMAELLLYVADRAQHVEQFIKPQLASGTHVLCDRFTDSTVAYQGYGRGLSLSKISQLNQIATSGLQSDLTLWLDLDVEVGLFRTRQRGPSDRMEEADLEFHRRVYHGFAQLAKDCPDRIIRVDASGSQSQVQAHIQTIITDYLNKWKIENCKWEIENCKWEIEN